jgi:hypothetical protein
MCALTLNARQCALRDVPAVQDQRDGAVTVDDDLLVRANGVRDLYRRADGSDPLEDLSRGHDEV